MASFIAKQLVGNKIKSVKGALGDDKEEGGDSKASEEAAEIEEARREMEERRVEKHRKMEEERETMRQSIRDKYGLKKKIPEEEGMMQQEDTEGRIGRKKKTAAELAAEANKDSDDEDEFTKLPNFGDISSKVQDLPQKLAQGVGDVSEKCSLQ